MASTVSTVTSPRIRAYALLLHGLHKGCVGGTLEVLPYLAYRVAITHWDASSSPRFVHRTLTVPRGAEV